MNEKRVANPNAIKVKPYAVNYIVGSYQKLNDTFIDDGSSIK